MAKLLEGTRAAAKYVGTAQETIRNWIARGLIHERKQLGGHVVLVFNSDDLDEFKADPNVHRRGPKAKQP